MAVYYNLSVTDALKLFYDNETFGINEKEIAAFGGKLGCEIPKDISEFLAGYGYLSVNRGDAFVMMPRDMKIYDIDRGEGTERFLAFAFSTLGDEDEKLYAVKLNDDDEKFPEVIVGTPNENGIVFNAWRGIRVQVPFHGENDAFHEKMSSPTEKRATMKSIGDVLNILFIANPGCHRVILEDSGEIDAALLMAGVDPAKLTPGTNRICYSEDAQLFFYPMFSETGITHLITISKADSREASEQLFAGISDEELNELFNNEFYVSMNYEHSLTLLNERVSRLNNSGGSQTELAELDRLSARCLWALGRYDEAERLYIRTVEFYSSGNDEQALIRMLPGVVCFYSDIGRREEADKYIDMQLSLCEKAGDFHNMGMTFQNMAQRLDKDIATIDEAIELYERAIELYQKTPKPEKYDIARCQQLRGDARRRRKEALKAAAGGNGSGH